MKRILSLVLVFVLLTGLSVPLANAEESKDYFYIPAEEGVIGAETYGFKNSEYWDNVYVYATGGRSEYAGGMTYPGEKLEQRYVDDYGYIYTFSFAVGYFDTLLFNDGTSNDYRADLKKDFYDYCLAIYGEENVPKDAEVIITDTMRWYDGTVLFTASGPLEPANAGVTEIIDRYCVHRSATYYPYSIGVYVSTNDEIYTLKEALTQEVIHSIPIDHGFSDFSFHRLPSKEADINLVHRCMEAFGNRYGYNPNVGESIYCEPYGYVGEYAVFYAYYDHYMYPSMNTKEQIGDYYFYRGMPCGRGENNSVALYVLSPEGEVYTLYEAYTHGLVTDLEAVVALTGGDSIFGDYGKRILELLGIDINSDSWAHLYREIRAYYPGDLWYEEPEEQVADYVVVFAAESTTDEAPSVKRIGDYVVASEHTYAPNELGYYVYFPYGDKVYSLEEAYEKYPQYSKEMIQALDYPQSGHYRLIGDADESGTINIKDATRIQKRIAGFDLGVVYREHLELEASDFNGDGSLDIRDATAIQKEIAGLL